MGTGARMDGHTPVMIDLGLTRNDPLADDKAVPGPPMSLRRLRLAALALGVALLLALGGSAAPGPPPLTEVATLMVAPDRGFVLTPDRLFVGTAGAYVAGQSVSAYEPGRGRLLWTSKYDRDTRAGGLSEQVADVLLIRGFDGLNTTAVDVRTGAVRWSVPGQLEALADGRTGLTREDVFPADAQPVDPSSQASDSYYWSSSGETYLVPPIGMVVHAFDLSTGRPLWSSVPVIDAVAARRSAAVPAGDVALVATTTDGRVERWDTRTGTTQQRLPAVDTEHSAAVVVGDLLVVQQDAGVTAYAVDTFTQRWHRTLNRADVSFANCGDRPCLGNDSGWRLLDPATGADAGPMTDPDTVRVSNGGQLVELRQEPSSQVTSASSSYWFNGSRLVRTVDPATGRTLADLTGWETMSTASPGTPVLLTRESSVIGPTWFGLLEPGATEVHLLGVVPYRATACQLAADVIACQDRSNVRIWRYHR